MSLSSQEVELKLPFVETSLMDVTDKLPFVPPCKIYFKNEYEQPSGSFKLRGIGNLICKSILKAKAQNAHNRIHVFASSGGNAGLAAAYLAEFYKVPCTVAVPTSTKPIILEKLKKYNAEVLMFGDSINEADKFLKSKMAVYDEDIEKIYCHPFENELIWEGHSTLIDEINASSAAGVVDKNKIKGVVCSIGGGGLYNGIYQGLQRNHMGSDILLLETKQAPTFVETIKRKEIFTLNSVKSMATSLACSYLSEQSLSNYLNQTKNGITTKIESIDDLDAIKASVQFYDIFKIPIEPACGAAVSVVLNRLDLLLRRFKSIKPTDAIVVVVCGGSCTDEMGLQEFRDLLGQSKL